MAQHVLRTAGVHLDADDKQSEHHGGENQQHDDGHVEKVHGLLLRVNSLARCHEVPQHQRVKPCHFRQNGEEQETLQRGEETQSGENLHRPAGSGQIDFSEGALPLLSPLAVSGGRRRDGREIGEQDGERGEKDNDAGEREEEERQFDDERATPRQG